MSKDFWSQIATTYEADHTRIVGSDLVAAIQAALVDAIPNRAKVVELGCGTGLFTRAHAKHCALVIATDISQAMLTQAEHALGDQPSVELKKADATATGLPGGLADAVVATNLLHIVPNPGAVLAEARRLLRAGGKLIAVDVTGQGMSFRNMVISAWRIVRRWGFASSGGTNYNEKTLSSAMSEAGFHEVQGRTIIGRSMNAAFVVGVRRDQRAT